MELAMDSLKEKFEFRVRWEPFLLRPDTPPDGLPKPKEYMNVNNPRFQYLREAGKEIGLDFSRTSERFPSTIKAHALLELAKEKDDGVKQNDVAEALFKKYFLEGDMLQDISVLQVAKEVGFEETEVKTYIENANNLKAVFNKASAWSQKGISGVPTFYMNGQKIFSGGQDVSVFIRMFEIAAEKFPLKIPESKN
ncbi:hypothetical protein CHS0354_023286 [Potamilus streckersoni]|uniref:DSBA-like thioredoxin domain-containing protein n=1 Tax=Potamilus streckersoni TaxID=2493646 RepID=A0AAE0W6A5_9BIVA|nr:hypothetical protein CHS0354_023286 [Potamilus streckersoni]